jgi:hypothetical protein
MVQEKRHKMMTNREINDMMVEQINARLKGNNSPAANLKSIDEIVTEFRSDNGENNVKNLIPEVLQPYIVSTDHAGAVIQIPGYATIITDSAGKFATGDSKFSKDYKEILSKAKL